MNNLTDEQIKQIVKDISDEEYEKLLGKPIPRSSYLFIKKNRLHVHYNTTVYELKYAKGWTGRLFSGAIRFAIKLLKGLNKKALANTLIMGVLHQPMRGLSRMTGGMITWGQLDGLILMFNGKFFKGLSHFIKQGNLSRKEKKQNRFTSSF